MKYVLIGLLILAGAIFAITFGINDVRTSQKAVQAESGKKTEEEEYSSQTKQMGAVEVELTPLKINPGENMLFELSLTTHSVDLSYDFTDIISATDDMGNNYKVLSWSGGSGGHHISGEIETEPLSENAQNIKLKVIEIDDQEVTFEWEL